MDGYQRIVPRSHLVRDAQVVPDNEVRVFHGPVLLSPLRKSATAGRAGAQATRKRAADALPTVTRCWSELILIVLS